MILEFLDSDGKPLAPLRCELLLVRWGGAELVRLEADGTRVRLPIDVASVRDRCGRDVQADSMGFLFIEAQDHAPVRSEAIAWIGQPGGDATRREETEFGFPGATHVALSRGSTATMSVRLRRAVPRVVRLATREGEPVSGALVRTCVFFSSSNHCARMSSREIASGRTDAFGCIEVPDGDWEVGLRIEAPEWLLEHPRLPEYPMELVTRLVDEETVVLLRRKVVRRLRLVVREADRPAPGKRLYARHARVPGGVCGAYSGLLDTTDREGRIDWPTFFPGDFDRLWLEDARGEILWEGDPREMDLEDVVTIELGD
ncbi:MAG: hypothetical protein GY711_06785 [bacterium]|nr:hypothetical protein [bacterium]